MRAEKNALIFSSPEDLSAKKYQKPDYTRLISKKIVKKQALSIEYFFKKSGCRTKNSVIKRSVSL